MECGGGWFLRDWSGRGSIPPASTSYFPPALGAGGNESVSRDGSWLGSRNQGETFRSGKVPGHWFLRGSSAPALGAGGNESVSRDGSWLGSRNQGETFRSGKVPGHWFLRGSSAPALGAGGNESVSRDGSWLGARNQGETFRLGKVPGHWFLFLVPLFLVPLLGLFRGEDEKYRAAG
jgi:hypothetical protein